MLAVIQSELIVSMFSLAGCCHAEHVMRVMRAGDAAARPQFVQSGSCHARLCAGHMEKPGSTGDSGASRSALRARIQRNCAPVGVSQVGFCLAFEALLPTAC